jgi:CRISPR/Cas system-associated protein Cas5 (RAMP superfamily)
MLYTLSQKKLGNQTFMAKMYRCGMRFLWINYSRIRLVRLRKPSDSFLRKKRSKFEVDYSLPSTAEVKKLQKPLIKLASLGAQI